MTGMGRYVLVAVALMAIVGVTVVWWPFSTDIAAARDWVAMGSTLIAPLRADRIQGGRGRARMIETVVATPPDLVATASPPEQARVSAMLGTILPVSARAAGLCADTAAVKAVTPAAQGLAIAPTLIIGARGDRYGNFPSAEYMAGKIKGAQFMGLETGGYSWVGQNGGVMAAISGLVASTQADLPP